MFPNHPKTDPTSKKYTFNMSSSQNNAFETLKKLFTFESFI